MLFFFLYKYNNITILLVDTSLKTKLINSIKIYGYKKIIN